MQLGCLPILRIPWAVGVRAFVKLGHYQSGNFASDLFVQLDSKAQTSMHEKENRNFFVCAEFPTVVTLHAFVPLMLLFKARPNVAPLRGPPGI